MRAVHRCRPTRLPLEQLFEGSSWVETVSKMAERYGTSTAFVLQALERIGFRATRGDVSVPVSFQHQFDKAYGQRIRDNRPTPIAEPPSVQPLERSMPLRVAYDAVEYKRNMQTLDRYKALPAEPDVVHALDVNNTREGDPWSPSRARFHRLGDVVYFEHGGPRAACGERVLAVLRRKFDDATKRPCPTCLELFRTGGAVGRFKTPEPYSDYRCHSYRRVTNAGVVSVWQCRHRSDHSGDHEDHDGNRWSDEDALRSR